MENGLEENQKACQWTTVIIQVKMKADWTKAVLEIKRRQWIRERFRKEKINQTCVFWNIGGKGEGGIKNSSVFWMCN